MGGWREVIKACMEKISFALGPDEKRMAEGKLVSGGTELSEKG